MLAFIAFSILGNHPFSLGVKEALPTLESRFLKKSSWESPGGKMRPESRQEWNEAGGRRAGQVAGVLRQSGNQG